ncbi:MAG: flagellin [Bacteroidetes bacterium]|jgi:flagellin|nr:flagellin [Bacteroidota bacterium]
MSFGDLTRINTNMQSLRAYNSLQQTNQRLGSAQLRLATGSRINQAADDSAGFAIANKLGARIRGQAQAQSNIGDAQSMLTVAEGGANTIMDILQTMKEKAVQANNDSLSGDERTLIQGQLDELIGEIDDIAQNADFNGVSLLDGQATLSFQVGAGTTGGDVFEVGALSGGFESATLSVSTGDIDVESDAGSTTLTNTISSIDTAIDTVSGKLAGIGDAQNRLSFKQQNLATSTDNYQAAKSRIMDADFAKEQMEVVKQQILQQTGTAALAQGNAAPQSVLSLIG